MKLSEDYVPSTINEAIDYLYSLQSAEDVDYMLREDHLPAGSFAGMSLRNAWSLWEKDTPLKRDALAMYDIAHADDVSGLIIKGLWAKARGEDIYKALLKEAGRYKKHWAKHGVNHLTGEKI